MNALPCQPRLPHNVETVFKPHPKYKEHRHSAVTLIKYLLAKNRPDALRGHYQELLDTLLWKITEAECSNKYKTRFQTQGAVNRKGETNLRHEHVFQRSRMIELLEKAAPHEVDDILKDAIGCTVTVEEHARLSKFDDEYGWGRYRKARITVIDTQTGE